MTLANKYRPQKFEDVIQQEVICKVLNKEIEEDIFPNAMLFTGPAGTGKTTCANIFASMVDGEIFPIDCASHNGVESIKDILEIAKTKPLVKAYKVFVLDECHTLSAQAWSAMLVTLEEAIEHSIFILCTTDVQKIPNTIMSRVQRFNFTPMSEANIINRLTYVCSKENITITDKGIEYIAKSANGNMRQALTNLDKCLLFGTSDEDICKALNIVSDDVMQELYDAYNDDNRLKIIELVEQVYNNGYELHLFIRQFLDYCLKCDNLKLVETLLTITNEIRYDDTPKNMIIARLIV
jgi:DNA polymerase-3 subunit gamma/tau